MLDAERCRHILAEGFPELIVSSTRFFAEGWDNELWEVNDDLLVRFPKRPECAEPLVREARLLAELAGALRTPVPRPEYVSDGCDAFPLPFFAYRKLSGTPLNQVTLSEQARRAVAQQLGRFLSELHRFPVERAAALGVPCFTAEAWREEYRRFREQTARKVTPLLTPGEREIVDAFWDDFLDDDRHFRFQPVLIHGDLGLEHILVDPDRALITGVIDFADARIGDPALDFAGLDDALRHAVLANYELPIDDTLPARARAYLQIGPFYEVLYGQETSQPEFVHSGLEGICRRIMRGSKKHK